MLALCPGLLFTGTLVAFGATRATERPWLALLAAALGFGLWWRAQPRVWPRWAVVGAALAVLAWLLCAAAFLPAGPELRGLLQPGLAGVVDQALALTGESVRPLALAPWRGLMEWGLWGALLALAAGTAARVQTDEQRRRLLGWLVGAGVAVLFVALVHRAQGAPKVWWISSVPTAPREPFFAPFASPNHAGATLAALLPLALALALAGQGRRRVLAAAAALALAAGVMATGSRAAVVDAIAAVGVGTVLLVGPRLRLALVVLAGFGLAALRSFGVERVLLWLTAEVAPRTYDAIEAGYSDVLTGRGDLYADALRLLQSQPWFGVGPAGFDGAFRAFKSTPEYLIYSYAHQEPLQIAIEHGLPVLVLLTIAFVALIGGASSEAAAGPRDEARIHRAAMVACLVAITVDAQVDFPLRIGAIATLGAVITGLLIGASARENAPSTRRPVVPALVALSVSVTFAVLGLEALDPPGSVWAPAASAEARADEIAHAGFMMDDGPERNAEMSRAIPIYQESVVREPLRRSGLQRLGRTWWALGELDQAEAALVAAVAVHPTLAWASVDLARLRASRGETAGAAAAWRQALSQDLPDDPTPLVAEALGTGPEMMATARLTLPERSDRWVTAGALADSRGDHVTAEALLRHGVELNPRAGLELAGSLVRWGRPEEAAALLEGLDPSCRRSLLLGQVQQASQHYKEAEAQFDDAVHRCGASDRRARFGLSRARVALGDPRGMRALEALIKEDPSDRVMLRALVRELQGLGRVADARRVQALLVEPVEEAAPVEAAVPER